MFGGRRNPLLAAHYMGDTHQMVVDDIGKMIGRQAVRFHQHLHIDDGIFKLNLAAQRVLHHAFAFARDFHTDDVGYALCVELRAVGIGECQAGPVIFWRLLRGNLVPPHVGQFFRCAITFESMVIGK
jgi:hypothetical protein